MILTVKRFPKWCQNASGKVVPRLISYGSIVSENIIRMNYCWTRIIVVGRTIFMIFWTNPPFFFYYECRLIGAVVITLGLYMVIWGKRGDNRCRVLPQEPQEVVLPQIPIVLPKQDIVLSPHNHNGSLANIYNFVSHQEFSSWCLMDDGWWH